ncbi:MAG TPA: hypothetical protein VFZ25_15825 [Chloroflexota bacterium]|nr:hypothetical protein [Chloroflexota bacterium]
MSTDQLTEEQIAAILQECKFALLSGEPVDLRALGYRRAVRAVRRHPAWVEQFADSIGEIDRAVFLRRVQPVFPVPLGAALLATGTALGIGLTALSFDVSPKWRGLTLLAGVGALLGSTHGLTHFLVGKLQGMSFVGWYLNGPIKVEPTLKIDQASYLKTPPEQRAWMHASGALVTKLIPFFGLAVGSAVRAPGWAKALLGILGVVQLITDAFVSTKIGDWSRFQREMRLARRLTSGRGTPD